MEPLKSCPDITEQDPPPPKEDLSGGRNLATGEGGSTSLFHFQLPILAGTLGAFRKTSLLLVLRLVDFAKYVSEINCKVETPVNSKLGDSLLRS
jgi:hypothetical protein